MRVAGSPGSPVEGGSGTDAITSVKGARQWKSTRVQQSAPGDRPLTLLFTPPSTPTFTLYTPCSTPPYTKGGLQPVA